MAARELQLEVFINGVSTELIAAFRQDADGGLAIEPDQLRNVGIIPVPEAAGPDGLIRIDRLPDVSFEFVEATQSIYFNTIDAARAPRIIDAGARTGVVGRGCRELLGRARELYALRQHRRRGSRRVFRL
jgi:outer membrane usher protein